MSYCVFTCAPEFGVIRFDQEPQLGNPQAGKRRLITGNSVIDFNPYSLPVDFRIVDLNGRVLFNVREYNENSFNLSSCNLGSGIYIIYIYNNAAKIPGY